MPAAYRAPRVGDLLAVRTSSPHDPEAHVVIHTVVHTLADTGGVLYLAGSWQNRDLEVMVRRVGATLEEPE